MAFAPVYSADLTNLGRVTKLWFSAILVEFIVSGGRSDAVLASGIVRSLPSQTHATKSSECHDSHLPSDHCYCEFESSSRSSLSSWSMSGRTCPAPPAPIFERPPSTPSAGFDLAPPSRSCGSQRWFATSLAGATTPPTRETQLAVSQMTPGFRGPGFRDSSPTTNGFPSAWTWTPPTAQDGLADVPPSVHPGSSSSHETGRS